MEKGAPVTRDRSRADLNLSASSGWIVVSSTFSRLLPGTSRSATSMPKKSVIRLLKKIGSPSGVSRQRWLGTMFTN